MHIVSLRRALLSRPFEPLVLCLTDGRRFGVRHPELCQVGAYDLQLALYPPGNEDDAPTFRVILSPEHVVSVQSAPDDMPPGPVVELPR